MAEELLQIRVTADFKEAEGAFLRLAKVATAFESNIRSISANLNREFNKIVGSAELFGNSTNVVADKMDALKRAMVSLMTLGFQPMSPEVQKLKNQYDALGASLTPIPPKLDNTGNALKKTNQQWTNLALVLQDLPYGFRGIQNNLPALVGGIAGMTGIIYFAASAVIALYTAYDMGAFKSKKATEEAKARTEQIKREKDATDSLFRSTASEAVEVTSLIAVIKSETETRNRKFSALEQLKKINPEIFNGLVLEKNAVIGLDKAYNKYIDSLRTIITVKIKQAELEAIIEKRLKAEGVTLSQEEKDLQATGKALNANRIAKASDLQQRNEIVKQQIKEAKSQVEINGLKKQEEDILRQIQSLSSGVKVTTVEDKAGAAKNKKDLKDYQDNLKKTDKLMSEMRKRAALGLLAPVSPIADSYDQDIKNAEKEVQDNLAFQIKNKAENSKKTIALIKEQYQTEVNEAEGSYEKIKIAQENMAANLNAAYMEDTITNEDRHKAFIDLTTKQTKAALDNANKLMAQTVQIGIGIMNALGPALDLLLEKGASIGEVLSKAFSDVIKKLVKVIITASIALLIMSALGLVDAGKLGATFGNMVAGGMGLGSGLFGGGGSTGADATKATNSINTIQTTPTGDNSGQFVLRGNDLVLALNRSETSLNLRRGS